METKLVKQLTKYTYADDSECEYDEGDGDCFRETYEATEDQIEELHTHPPDAVREWYIKARDQVRSLRTFVGVQHLNEAACELESQLDGLQDAYLSISFDLNTGKAVGDE